MLFFSLRIFFFNLKSLFVILSSISLIGCANLTPKNHSQTENLPTEKKVVIAGSFHKSIDSISKVKEEMEQNGIKVLEPLCGKVINRGDDYIVLENDNAKTLNNDTYREIQKRFMDHCKEADIIFVYNEDGYIGLSTAFEIGFSKGMGKKIYVNSPPKDKGLEVSDIGEVMPVNEFIKTFRRPL